MKKRILSMFVAIIMIATSVPMLSPSAFSAEEASVEQAQFIQSKQAEFNYNTLYVGYNAETESFDRTSLIVDFFEARATDVLAYSNEASANDITIDASSRFGAASSNFTPYTVYSTYYGSGTNNPTTISGLTAPIKAPWYQSVTKNTNAFGGSKKVNASIEGLADGTHYIFDSTDKSIKEVVISGGAATSYTEIVSGSMIVEAAKANKDSINSDGTLNFETYDFSYSPSYQVLNVFTKGSSATCAYYGFGTDVILQSASEGVKVYAKTNNLKYPSSFGDGYVNTGRNSLIYFDNAIKKAIETKYDDCPNGYTVQFIAQRTGTLNGAFVAYLGARIGFSGSDNSISVYSNNSNYVSFTGLSFDGFSTLDVNSYTLAFDRSNTAASGDPITIHAYVNGVHKETTDAKWKADNKLGRFFPEADEANVFAIRVYNFILSEEQINQNNFADIAKWHKLDVSTFFEATDEKKAELYEAFETYTFKTISKESAQAIVNEIIGIEKYTVTFVDYNGEILSVQTVSEGKAATAPAVPERDGYAFAGWDKDFSNITADTIVTATYLSNAFTVTFVDYDGTVLSIEAVESGKGAVAPSDPVRDGYTFIGWDKDFSNITADIEVKAVYKKVFDSKQYNTLYVGYNAETESFDRTSLIVDFFEARATDEPLSYSNEASANDITIDASSRFGAASSNFTPYTVYSTYYGSGTNNPTTISGLTAPIKAPWYQSVTKNTNAFGGSKKVNASIEGLADGTHYIFDSTDKSIKEVVISGGAATSYTEIVSGSMIVEAAKANKDSINSDGTLNFETYDFSYSPSYQVLNVFNKGSSATCAYYGFGTDVILQSATEGVKVYAKTNNLKYPSSFGDGYVHTGRNSLIYFDNAIKNARDTKYDDCDDGYTVQFIAQRADTLSTNLVAYLGARVGFSGSGNSISFYSENSNYVSFSGLSFDGFSTLDVNSYTVAFDKSTVAASGDPMTIHAYVNGIHKQTSDAVWKKNDNMGRLFSNSDDANVFAIRVYNFILSEEQINQNNFADIAKWHQLDVSMFFEASEEKQAQLYEAFETYTFKTISKESAQAIVDEIIGIKEYTVTFADYNGEIISTQTVQEGKAALAPTLLEREGYTFTGWDKDFSNIIADITVTAQYKINTYTVTFVDYDGIVISTETVEHGGDATAPASPVREGYTFTGWDNEFTDVKADKTITAQYRINTYTVIFVDYDGRVISTQSIEHGSNAIAPASPEREGYAFDGWDKPFTNITTDTTITAQYLENAFTVTFVDHDGTILSVEAIVYGNTATAPASPKRDGYTFTGWDKDFSNITEEITITAQYKINTYIVTFVDYDGRVISTQSVEYGGDATAPTSPEREGYTFSSWDKDFVDVKTDVTVTAQYKINSYTVTFVGHDGAFISSDTVEYNSAAKAPSAPAREGYNFTGWDKDFSSVKEDMTVTAQYKAVTFTVKFADYNGTILSTVTVEYGKAATAPASPTREGYNFVGWDTAFTNVKANITVTAIYESIVDWSKYDALYVGYNKETETFDKTSLIVDFFRARETDAPMSYSNETTANDVTVNAYSRFGAAISNFTPYTVYSTYYGSGTNNPTTISGLTAPIKAPWYAAVNNKSAFGGSYNVVTSIEGLADGTYCLYDSENKTLKQIKLLYGNATYTDLLSREDLVEAGKANKGSIAADGSLNFEAYDFSYSPSYQVLNVLNKGQSTAIGHYGFATDVIPPDASNGVKVYAKTNNLIYPSSWGDGFVHMGRNSMFYFDNAIKNARDTKYDDCDDGYTVQFIAQRADTLSTNLVAYLGARVGFSGSGNSISFYSENSNYVSFSSLSFDGFSTLDVNSYTVAFDKSGVASSGDPMTIHAYVNGVHKATTDATWKKNDNMGRLFPSSDDANVFAIRVYNRVLTEAEVDHNNLIDIAKFYAIDIDRIEYILSLEEEAKNNILKEAYSIKLTREKSNAMAATELEAIIAKYAPKDPTLEGTENTIEFLGYQARLASFPGIRATFTYSADEIATLEAEGYSIELGVIMAIANDGRIVDDLKLTKKGDGFIAAGIQMIASPVYKNGAAVGGITNADSKNPEFVYTITYKNASSQTYAMYTLDCIYRAYLVASKDGVDYITYYNCESTRFEESISIYELSTVLMYDVDEPVDSETVKSVINTVGYTDDAKAYYGYYTKAVEMAKDGVINIPISQLNLIYTAVLRAERDPLLARKLKYYEAAGEASNPDGNLDICEKINALLDDYSAVHGVEVRDELQEIDETNAELVFDVVTDKAPHSYKLGDGITFTISLRDNKTGMLIPHEVVNYSYQIEGGGSGSGSLSATGGVCSFTIPASEISASSLADKGMAIKAYASIPGVSKTFQGGAIVDMDKISVSAEEPDDFEEFWKSQIERVLQYDPTDTVADNTYGTIEGYDDVVISDIRRSEDENGHAVYSKEYGNTITEDNYFHAYRVDAERLAYLQSKGYNTTVTASTFNMYDIYEIYVKAPGPAPAACVLAIPKTVRQDTNYRITFAGYDASSPGIATNGYNICLALSHSGYWVDASRAELYNELVAGILKYYGRACGEINSGYADANDNYILYSFLRNIQAIRFITDLPETTDGIEDEVLKEIYDKLINIKNKGSGKNVFLSGGSMGGYHSLGTATIIEFYNKYNGESDFDIPLTGAEVNVPTFCNFGGPEIDGRFTRTAVDMGYEGKNHNYFDGAFFANYITVPVSIPRCGLSDYTCPPSSIIAMYNNLKCKKSITFYQNSTHTSYMTSYGNPYIPTENYMFTVSENAVTE